MWSGGASLLESGAGAAERVSVGVGGRGAFRGALANVADFAKFPWRKNLGGRVNH